MDFSLSLSFDHLTKISAAKHVKLIIVHSEKPFSCVSNKKPAKGGAIIELKAKHNENNASQQE